MRSTTLLLTLAATLAVPLPALAQGTDTKTSGSEGDKKADSTGTSTGAASGVEPPKEEWDVYDVTETPGKNYMFVGLRYRGNLIPQFMINMFVDEGATVYTNMIGVEFDLRKDG